MCVCRNAKCIMHRAREDVGLFVCVCVRGGGGAHMGVGVNN